MRIDSPDFIADGAIPARNTCTGENVLPTLRFSGVPEEAKTLAIVIDDPDAPNGTWVHWVAWNIPAGTTVIKDGELPEGTIEGTTSFGHMTYEGPCPPSGVHRYFFKVFALDTELELSQTTTAQELEKEIASHTVDKAGLIGVFAA